MIRHAVAGVLAVTLMIVARIALSEAGHLPHYPGFELAGKEGLKELGLIIAFGAGYGLLYGWLVRPVLPSGWITPALVFTLVPFLVEALALPLYHGKAVVTQPWVLLYKFMHYFIFSLGLVFLGGKGGASSKE